jgi:Na+/H+ antiporter NhaD/arsenite permease-like protein
MTGPEDSIRVTAGRPGHDVAGSTGRRGLPVPSEAIALAATVLAILIAAAVADNFESPLAWGFVTFLVALYILSRGLVKRGTGRGDDGL